MPYARECIDLSDSYVEILFMHIDLEILYRLPWHFDLVRLDLVVLVADHLKERQCGHVKQEDVGEDCDKGAWKRTDRLSSLQVDRRNRGWENV